MTPKGDFFTLRTVLWQGDKVKMIDQTRLPGEFTYVTYNNWRDVAAAIKSMVIRGAPAIGVAAGMGVALAATQSRSRSPRGIIRDMEVAATGLKATRPTAINLFWGVDRVMKKASRSQNQEGERMKQSIVREVKRMADEDVEANKTMGKIGALLIKDGDTVLTQCNAGALATVGYGTALGVIRAAKEVGKCVKVIVPETRPALQGSRLTAFELARDDFDCTVISDTAIGYMMGTGRVDKVLVGADRITKDGYLFNKIGTYQIAVLANRHRIPFYPAAPRSTFDLKRFHDQVTIEERSVEEVVKLRGRRVAPKGVAVANPAFDTTPPGLISGIITEEGFIKKPVEQNIRSVIC